MGDLLGIVAIVLTLAVGGLFLWDTRDIRNELKDLRQKYNNLILEYWRVVGENEWLRRQLRIHGIAIPPLPEELRPHMDTNGNISIVVNAAGQDINKVDIGAGAQMGQTAIGSENEQDKSA